jgi:hypothetical protein
MVEVGEELLYSAVPRQSGRVDQDHRAHPSWVQESDSGCDEASPRVADQNRLIKLKTVKYPNRICDVLGDGKRPIEQRWRDAAHRVTMRPNHICEQVGYRCQVIVQTRSAMHEQRMLPSVATGKPPTRVFVATGAQAY